MISVQVGYKPVPCLWYLVSPHNSRVCWLGYTEVTEPLHLRMLAGTLLQQHTKRLTYGVIPNVYLHARVLILGVALIGTAILLGNKPGGSFLLLPCCHT